MTREWCATGPTEPDPHRGTYGYPAVRAVWHGRSRAILRGSATLWIREVATTGARGRWRKAAVLGHRVCMVWARSKGLGRMVRACLVA
jgi:hypothetical protein